MKKYISVLLLLLIPIFSHACLWLEGVTIDGEYKEFANQRHSYLLKASQEITSHERFDTYFYRENNQTKAYTALEDIMKGKDTQGIQALLEIDKETPNLYATASNLGTAYELQGDLPSAIHWISEGIRRNADAHYGTEWLHLLILQTKQRLQKDPSFLAHTHLIPLPEKFDENTVIGIGQKHYTIKDIKEALFAQLRERLYFIKDKEPIVADLLYTFAKIEEQTTIMSEAMALLKMAEEYGFAHEDEIDAMYRNEHSSNLSFFGPIGAYGLIFLILLVFFIYYKKEISQHKVMSQIHYAFSLVLHLIMFEILTLLTYSFFHNIFYFHLLLIPVYIMAMHHAHKGMKKQYTIPLSSHTIWYILLIYYPIVAIVSFKILENTTTYNYLLGHTLLTAVIIGFMKWKISKEEN